MKNIVFVGDSITDATEYGVINSYPELIVSSLNSIFNDLTFFNEGLFNTDTSQWVPWIDTKILNHSPDLVTIMLGSNDQATGRVSLTDYEANLREIILRVIGKSDIIIMTPPAMDESKNTYGPRYNSTLAQYAQVVIDLANEFHLPLVDNFNAFYAYINNGTIGTLYTQDGLHPDDDGHLVIYSGLLPKMIGVLNKSIFTKRVYSGRFPYKFGSAKTIYDTIKLPIYSDSATKKTTFTADTVSMPNTFIEGAAIAVLYNNTHPNKPLIGYIVFGEEKNTTNGEFRIEWDSVEGIFSDVID